MYAPLAAVVTGVVIGGYLGGRWLIAGGVVSPWAAQPASVCLAAFASVVLGMLTFHRNTAYYTAVSISGRCSRHEA